MTRRRPRRARPRPCRARTARRARSRPAASPADRVITRARSSATSGALRALRPGDERAVLDVELPAEGRVEQERGADQPIGPLASVGQEHGVAADGHAPDDAGERRLFQERGEPVGVGSLEVDQRHAEHALDGQRVAADLADHARGGAERASSPRPGRRRRTRPGPRRTGRPRPATVAPRPDASAHSASATATPPSATSCAECRAPARTAWRTAACSALSSPRSAAGSGPSTGSPRSFDSSDAAFDGAHDAAVISAIAAPGSREPEPAGAVRVRQLADEADDRRRVDRALGALVVERDVAAHDRDPERAAGVAEPGDRARELPGDVRLLGVAEVQAVGEPERLGADAGEVRGALEHGLDRAPVRVGGDPPAVAVDRDRDRGPRGAVLRRVVEQQHGGVGLLRAADGARADDRVVLLERPLPGREVRGRQQPEQDLARSSADQHRVGHRVQRRRRLGGLEVVGRALVDERGDRHVADQRRRRRTRAGAACR